MDQPSEKQLNNARLVHAMQAVALQDDPDTRRELYESMLDSILLVPTNEPVDPHIRDIQPGEEIAFITLETADGKLAWPFFTHRKAALAWQSDIHFYGFKARYIFQLARQSGIDSILINPAGPVGGQVMHWEIADLADGKIPVNNAITAETIIHYTRILVGAPAQDQLPTPEVVERVKQVLRNHQAVSAGFLFMLGMEDRAPQVVLGVQFTAQIDGQIDAKHTEHEMTAIAGEIAFGLGKHSALGLLVLSDDLLPVVTNSVSPIFKRE